MHENPKEDIYRENLEYIMLSLFSNKINVLIIGAGRAALIKAKTFLSNGCNIKIVAKDINEEFYKLSCEKISIIKSEYDEKFLKGNHIVVIAIDDDSIIKSIIKSCEALDKIYIDCKNPKGGIGVIPMNMRSKEVFLGINTLRGNPKASRMMGDYILDEVKEFDDFIRITSIIRNNVKSIKNKKDEILDFIISDDFKYIISKGKEELTLKLFYEEELVNKLFKN
ncbi:NAD(P)-dependent oxidoreductase [Clostridium sardiniense]|uniref:NAD(P)-dependent oxidoreductase n=1 Tax=Clostridium sardiniense TaxID=29369 RepID=UPI003D32EA50